MNWRITFFCLTLLSACSKNEDAQTSYIPTPQPLNVPELFKTKLVAPIIPTDNPQTVEGIALGKKLFFDTQLSGDGTQSCASCHNPSLAFSDNTARSEGIEGHLGSRNAMPLFNLAWNYNETFFWDGRSFSLEAQALIPVEDPVEMHNSWDIVVKTLQSDTEYPELFEQAFSSPEITKERITMAIAQFERTLISADAPFDKYLLGKAELSTEVLNGFNIFMDETKGDCFHCHGSDNNPLWTDNDFHNNGLDSQITDIGLAEKTGDPADNGKFKTPSLRNLKFTAPYMHDGRFNTLDEVINHYSEGLKQSSTIDPLMKRVAEGGVHLTPQEKSDLKAFLLALSDEEFISNSNFKTQ